MNCIQPRVTAVSHPILVALLCLNVVGSGCETSKQRGAEKRTHMPARRDTAAPAIASSAFGSTDRPRWSPRPETKRELDEAASVVRKIEPFTAPSGRLSFFARNLASLTNDAVTVSPVRSDLHKNPCRTNRLSVDGPLEITPLNDQSLLVLGAKAAVVLDPNCETQVRLPRISYIPGNQLISEPRWPQAFTILDTPSGTTYRYRWRPDTQSISNVLLPAIVRTDPLLDGSVCAPMLDASLACVHHDEIVVAWPGHVARRLGRIELGPPVVKLLRSDRADRVRIIRQDATLEEHELVSRVPRILAFPLPPIALDIAAGRGFLAVLRAETERGRSTSMHLVVLENDGTLRWSVALDTIEQSLSEPVFHRQFYECRSLAVHPSLPWIAVSNCNRVSVYDAANGQLVQDIERAAN